MDYAIVPDRHHALDAHFAIHTPACRYHCLIEMLGVFENKVLILLKLLARGDLIANKDEVRQQFGKSLARFSSTPRLWQDSNVTIFPLFSCHAAGLLGSSAK